MSYSTDVIETGLPFFDDTNKQGRNKPYFTAYLSDWICPIDRLPPFQFAVSIDDATITSFNLINVDTGATTDYLTHFLASATNENSDITKWWIYDGDIAVTLTTGRYYFYAQTTDGYEKYSEVFTVTSLEDIKTDSAVNQLDIGLPFFDDINKQLSKKPYFNSHIVNWLSAGNRFPPFQIKDLSGSGMLNFDLINSVTGATVSYLSYFTANTTINLLGSSTYYYSHLGLEDVTVANGRYYFYAKNVSSTKEWWSEEFIMCDNIEEQPDYLLISSTDILLVDSTDKLRIG